MVGKPSEPPSESQLVALPDGDKIALEVSTPETWTETQPTCVMIHGLCGCHQSSYLVRLSKKLYERGIRAIRMNLRGCGSGAGLAKNLYHSGRSDDVLAVFEALTQEYPDSPRWLVGFSLGGNIALKYASEIDDPRLSLDQTIAICPPVDLLACSKKFSIQQNKHYDRYFVKNLKQTVRDRLVQFKDLEPIEFPEELTLYEFDDMFTAPRSGFKDALDYYERCSSGPLLHKIASKTDILFSKDDPLIDDRSLEKVELPSNIEVHHTEKGGHLGFLGRPFTGSGMRWIDAWIIWKLLS